MIYAKPATSLVVVFRAYLASDHVTPATGKTIAITISKNGGAFGNPNAGATNATELSSGFYKVTLDTTDTGTAGPLAVRGAVATIDDVGIMYYVGQTPADVTHLLGTAWLTPGTAGTPDVNMKLAGGGTVPSGAIPNAVAGAAGGLFIAGTNAATTVTTSFTTTFTGNLTGSVASVTGAVGSVTGNVGGNVTGSVGSISGITFPTNFSALLINASGHISRVTLTDTLTTYTGNTVQTGDTYALANGASGFVAIKGVVDTVSTNVSTALSRLGSITGSGINTVLGFFKAVLSKTATTPSDIGGTFDPATDSTEAIRDRGDAAWTTGGASSSVQILGSVTKSGSTYYVSFVVVVGGQIVSSGSLSSLVTAFYDEDGTDLTYSGTPTAGSNNIIASSGTLGTAVTDNRPVMVKVGATYSGTAYTAVLPAVSIT